MKKLASRMVETRSSTKVDAAAPDATPASSAAEGKLQSAARGASYNVVLQLVLRLSTFGVNAMVVRKTSPAMLGLVNVRLTILYVRTACAAWFPTPSPSPLTSWWT